MSAPAWPEKTPLGPTGAARDTKKSSRRKAFYTLDIVVLVCLNVVSVLPVFTCVVTNRAR